MEEFTNWSQLFFDSLRSFGQSFMTAMPRVLGAILIIFLGWLFARFLSRGVQKLLKTVKFDRLADRINTGNWLEKANIKSAPSVLIAKFIYWVLLLLVVITAAETLGWTAISQEISKLLDYLPNLLAAVIFFVIGIYIATFVRDMIRGATKTLGISAGRIISSFVFYLLFLLISLTALDQAGIDTTIITSNLLLIIGSIMAAAAISYGLASREVLANILAAFFSRKTFQKGQTIEIDGQQGKIIDVTNVAVILKLNEQERLVVPTHQLITKQIKIITK